MSRPLLQKLLLAICVVVGFQALIYFGMLDRVIYHVPSSHLIRPIPNDPEAIEAILKAADACIERAKKSGLE